MVKNRLFIIIVLALLSFFVGCLPEESESNVSITSINPKLESAIAEPNLFEPNEVEPVKSEPNEVGRPEAEPNYIEPQAIEPNETAPAQVEPNELEVSETEPNEVEPIGVEPNDVKSSVKAAFYDKYADILSSFVDEKGMVDYRKLKLKRLKLKQMLEEVAELNPDEYKSWPKEDRLAFWINMYNVQLLKIIVENYPIEAYRWLQLLPGWEPDSIRHINKRIGGISKQKFIVIDEEFTLLMIEQQFFRKEFDEPRAFLALFHATISGPPLRNEPYYGDKLRHQLDDQAKKFLSSPLVFDIDRRKQKVYLSPMLQPTWFGGEFIGKYGTGKKFKDQQPAVRAVLSFITNYISEQDKDFLEVEYYSIEYMKYNWRLNDSSEK
jgi:hypothetical protein